MPQADKTHWTNKGVFKIEAVTLRGDPYFELRCNDRYLGIYVYPWTAAESISKGEHDQSLGFKASELNVPVLAKDWNNLA